jgi:hypothetical protein
VLEDPVADVPYAERIASLASRKVGLEYWLDVHEPSLSQSLSQMAIAFALISARLVPQA